MDKLFGIVIVFFLSVLGVFGTIEVFLSIYDSFIEKGYSVAVSAYIVIFGGIISAGLAAMIIIEKPFQSKNK
jgi:hypothetical protein